MLLISRNFDRGGDSLVYLSPDARTVRWESAPMGDSGNSWVLAYDAEMIYVADGARLLGLGRADGGLRWEAPLSDRIFYNGCRDCLRAVDGVVVALSDDGVIQAFRGASGAPLWSVRLRETTRQLVVFDDLVGAPDARPNANDATAGLYFYNIADGSPARTIEPACNRSDGSWEDHPHYYDPIYVTPDGDGLYWLLDSAACLVRANASGIAAVPPVYLPKDFSASSSNAVFVTDDALYLSDRNQLVAVDAGGARVLFETEDYELRPIAARGNTLLIQARRWRGSTRYELWAIDLTSGARRWERILSGDDPPDGPFDSGDWALEIVGEALALVEQLDDPEELRYELINLNDGTSRASMPVAVDDPDGNLRGTLFGRNTVFLANDELYAVELSSGQTLYRWPAP